MPAIKQVLTSFFRGKRVAIPLVAVAVVVFFALGGHQKIAEAVVGKVVNYLMGGVEIDMSDADLLSVAEAQEVGNPGFEESRENPADALSAQHRDEPGEQVSEPDVMVAQVLGATEAAVDTTKAEPKQPKVYAARAYTASNLRDPFYSLITTEETQSTKLLDVSRAKMVGSVWGETGIIALLEDDRGRSYALRVGDKVVNGKVTAVTPGSVTFSITVFGMTKQVTLEIAEEGEW